MHKVPLISEECALWDILCIVRKVKEKIGDNFVTKQNFPTYYIQVFFVATEFISLKCIFILDYGCS